MADMDSELANTDLRVSGPSKESLDGSSRNAVELIRVDLRVTGSQGLTKPSAHLNKTVLLKRVTPADAGAVINESISANETVSVLNTESERSDFVKPFNSTPSFYLENLFPGEKHLRIPSTIPLLGENPGSSGKSQTASKLVQESPSSSTSKDILKCEDCEYSTANKHYLKQHIDLVHTDERPFRCPFCDYAGKRSHSLKEHLVVHSSDRPYECHLCNATFRKKGHLTNHIKMHSPSGTVQLTIDSGSRGSDRTDQLYVCKLCDFTSSAKPVFMQHLNTHNKKENAAGTDIVSSSSWVTMTDQGIPVLTASAVLGSNNAKQPVVLMKCTECGYTSSDKDMLRKHMWVHIQPDKSPDETHIVQGVSASEESPLTPQQPPKTPTDQPSGNSFKCGECLHETTEAYKFIAHMLTHKASSAGNNTMMQGSQGTVSQGSQGTVAQGSQGSQVTTQSPPKNSAKLPPKQPTTPESTGFTHNKSVGKFCCNICGYTCDHQRTIKAHAWKHSGHKDIDYPMFQNGPISIYDDIGPDGKPTIVAADKVGVKENVMDQKQITGSGSVPVFKLLNLRRTAVPQSNSKDTGKVPLALLSKVNDSVVQVQTALADSARDLQKNDLALSTGRPNGDSFSGVRNSFKTIHLDEAAIKTLFPKQYNDGTVKRATKDHDAQKSNASKRPLSPSNLPGKITQVGSIKGAYLQVPKKFCTGTSRISPNVVVERIHSLAPSSVFTGLNSQQNSPCGVDTLASVIQPSHGDNSKVPDASGDDRESPQQFGGLEDIVMTEPDTNSPEADVKEDRDSQSVQSAFEHGMGEREICENMTHNISAGDEVTASTHGESALTLLSLLQKGLEQNLGVPVTCVSATALEAPLSDALVEVREEQVVSVDEGCQTTDDAMKEGSSSNEQDESESKPKAGICSSLLAVIEQLRERSKSESETDEQSLANPGGKRKQRKRNQRISRDVLCYVETMDNVEKLEDIEMKYRCKLCHYTSSPQLIKQHMRLHKTKKPFECSLCDFVAGSSETLQDHMIQHCKMRTYQCKLCPSAFNYKSQLRAHMRAHSEKGPFMCDLCDFETTNPVKFRLHSRNHSELSTVKCETCDTVFSNVEELTAHQNEGCKPGSLICEDCMFETASKEDFKDHLKIHKKRNLRCPVCDIVCPSQSSLRLHSRTHDEAQEMKCDLCSFLAASSRSLKSHMKRHINDQRYVQQPLEQYKCNLCGYVCHHLPSLKSHMWRHASDKNYIYELTNEVINAAIDYDSRQEDTSGTVKSENRDTESSSEAETAPLAAKIINSAGDRLTEKRSGKVIPCLITFRCCQCGFETISKYDLNQHMSLHSDIIQKTLEVSQTLSQSGITDKRYIVESMFKSATSEVEDT